jgi:hypothetical protein
MPRKHRPFGAANRHITELVDAQATSQMKNDEL